MKKYIILLIISLLAFNIKAQNQNLTVSSLSGQSVETILQQYLAGEGVLITGCNCPGVFDNPAKFNNQAGNITYPQIGSFNRNGFTSFPFTSGLVMTTGNVSIAAGPNNSSSASSAVSPSYTETALSSYTTNNVTSSASLEFDFIAMTDEFSFNFIFGSEEYCEYVNSSFNDVFAFLLTGVDPVTYTVTTKNVAIVPGTVNTPVSINNVNHGYHSSSSSGPGTNPSNSQYFIHNSSTNGVQYDGYTTSLSAGAVIFACQTYHMKLAVSNVGDNAYDSGVFLEQGSFYSPKVHVEKVWETAVGGDTMIQNCRNMDLSFSLERPSLTSTTSIIIEPSGDAILGVDYIMVKENGDTMNLEDNSFYFPEGDTLQLVHVKMLPTAQFPNNNPVKEVVLRITTQGCTGYGLLMDHFQKFDTIYFYLLENDSVQVSDTTFTRCDQLDSMRVIKLRGTDPLHYTWLTLDGDTLQSVTNPDSLFTECNITESGSFRFAASDRWNCMTDTASVEVTIVPKPEFDVTYTPDHGCQPLPVTLQVQYTPDNAALLWNIYKDSTYTYIDSVATLHASLADEGYYSVSLTVTSAPGCSDSITLDNIIHVSGFPHADFTYGPDEPENGQEVYFYNLSTGNDITGYVWNFGDGHSSYLEEPSHVYHLQESDLMTVHLTVTNSDGCSDDTLVVIPVEDNFAFYAPNAFTPNTDGRNEVFLPKVKDVANYELMIFARNGEILFHTTNPEEGWDGNFKGAPVPEGVYLWRIKYARIGTPDEMLSKMGTVTVIR